MPLDPQYFFIIILDGFMAVWTFRYFTKSRKTAEFEYLGLSAFWGAVMFIMLALLQGGNKEKLAVLDGLLTQPHIAGAFFSVVAIFAGWLTSHMVGSRLYRKLIEAISPKVK